MLSTDKLSTISLEISWQPLALLKTQFDANLAALEPRDAGLASRVRAFKPTHEYFLHAGDQQIHLAYQLDNGFVPLPNPVTPSAAGQIAMKLYPTGQCTEGVIVAGLDQGWLWDVLFKLPIHTPITPGHTPPLYLLAPQIEKLWIALHVHDWRELLSASRSRIFAGIDCVEQSQQHMAANLELPIPKLSVTIDPQTWTNGSSVDSVTQFARAAAGQRLKAVQARSRSMTKISPVEVFADANRKLRVMGVTSRFTTFLQYSMRDWLEAFEGLGHETKLVIEPEESALLNSLSFAEACADFRPDLIVMIDHYRGELNGMPKDVPFVMWIQDELAGIFSATAGAAQGPLDYTIGYGRLPCVYQHGYPSARFMPAMLGTNPRRFQPRRITGDEYARFACDVSFVSHCSTPAEVLVQAEIDKQDDPAGKKLLRDVFDRFRARYDAGDSITLPSEIEGIINDALLGARLNVDQPTTLVRIFTHKINNALIRHQSLDWLAEMDVRLHLFGRGWEKHPRFAKFARGVADNEVDLSAIYQASKINLQVTPFGSAHQRMFDGLAAGGFFLIRHCAGDHLDQIYRNLWRWCESNGVRRDAELCRADDPQVDAWLDEIKRLSGQDPMAQGYDFVFEQSITGQDGFIRNASTLWHEYDRVAYNSREQLQQMVSHFLNDDADRAQVTRSMRERVLENRTYQAVAKQTIDFVREDLQRSREQTSQARAA